MFATFYLDAGSRTRRAGIILRGRARAGLGPGQRSVSSHPQRCTRLRANLPTRKSTHHRRHYNAHAGTRSPAMWSLVTSFWQWPSTRRATKVRQSSTHPALQGHLFRLKSRAQLESKSRRRHCSVRAGTKPPVKSTSPATSCLRWPSTRPSAEARRSSIRCHAAPLVPTRGVLSLRPPSSSEGEGPLARPMGVSLAPHRSTRAPSDAPELN